MRRRRWEQRFNLRPSQKSMASRPRRARYTQAEVDAELLEGMEVAKMLGQELGRRTCEAEVERILEALENGSLDQLRREVRGRAADRLMDVADATGVTPMGDTADEVGDHAERWLNLRDDYLRILHDEERAAGRRCGWPCWRCDADGD